MIDLKKVSERLKSRRIEMGLSLQDVSEKTGLSPSTIMRYESKSIHKLPLENLALLADALDISISDLLGIGSDVEEEESKNLTAREKSMVARYRRLNDVGREKVIDYISDISYRYGKE